MKTEKEIQQEIEKLEEMKPKVRHFTMFGDNNHNAIAAQIEVLKTEMDESDVDDMKGTEEEDFNDGEWTEHEIEAARQAVLWRDGEEDESPSEGWAPLVQ